jgi:hypothetical protein
VPPGASGSSQMSAKCLVPAGAPSHFNGGEISPASREYLTGMGWSFRKLELVIVNLFMAASFPSPSAKTHALKRIAMMQTLVFIGLHFPPNSRPAQVLLANRPKTRTLRPASGMTPTQVGACQPRRERLRWLLRKVSEDVRAPNGFGARTIRSAQINRASLMRNAVFVCPDA